MNYDEERIGNSDRALAVLTNLYSWEMFEWYHSKYPEGQWDAVIVNFNNDKLLHIMQDKCETSHFFNHIFHYDRLMANEKIMKKILLMFGYFFQYMTHSREKHDRKLVEKICGHADYKKVVVQSKVGIFQTACVNAMCDRIVVCFEDGFGDYVEVPRFFKVHEVSDIINFLLAKMNVVNISAYGQQFKLKYDDRTIKYCSIPERMRYRNFKAMKQMYEGYKSEERLTEEEKKYFKKNYEVILFSTPFSDFGIGDEIYDEIHEWIKKNCSGKSILIKKHPRETYRFEWNDVLFDICGENISGEKVIDLLPDAEAYFFITTTILMKMRREKKEFKVFKFNINNKKYLTVLKTYADIIGIGEKEWIEI